MTLRRVLPLLLVVLSLITIQAFPSDDTHMRLARISYLEGNVSYQNPVDPDWASASINMPLEPGDRIYTGPGGKTEIEFDDGSVVRLAEHTDVDIMDLRTDLVRIRILQGFTYINARGTADFEINTPAAAFSISRIGLYRFHVRENGDVDAIVRKGSLGAANDSFQRRIEQGERLYIHYADSGRPLLSMYGSRDAWDEWNDRRDADRVALASRRHIPDSVHIGVSELDRHGRWANVSSHGWVWVPHSVNALWSPYTKGRWLYRPFYGWTWVSYEPWGWLPYHY
ncbi:MAG TPA: FecR family protein, partial [Acidobacteriota bacterium]|nr:FecR family protein [Acidobacteriota bacterium]